MNFLPRNPEGKCKEHWTATRRRRSDRPTDLISRASRVSLYVREFDISVEFVTEPNQTFSQVQTTEASRFKSDSLISLHGSLDGERKKGREGGIQGQQKSSRGKSSAGGAEGETGERINYRFRYFVTSKANASTSTFDKYGRMRARAHTVCPLPRRTSIAKPETKNTQKTSASERD